MGWRKIYHSNSNQKKVGVAILISDRADVRERNITRDKEKHYNDKGANTSRRQNNL